MKYKVKAIQWNRNLLDSEVGRPRELNEVFEVSEARLSVLQKCDQLELEVVEKLADAKLEDKKEVKKAKK